MPELTFVFGKSPVKVIVESKSLSDIGRYLAEISGEVPNAGYGQCIVISDQNVAPTHGRTVVNSLHQAGCQPLVYILPAGESSKSLTRVAEIYDWLGRQVVERDAVIVAVGGGVVSDVVGFVAATWMRGVRFVICPTTLESDVDACLGGKTGINTPAGKNLVGAFHQPELIVVDPTCLETLDHREVRAGLAESVKHSLITSEETFLARHEQYTEAILSLDRDLIAELIARNLQIKGDIVTQDTKEQNGVRMWLNFGHTVGHAIEACCAFRLRHGECVALGMVAACQLSVRMGLLEQSLVDRISRLLQRFELPVRLPKEVSEEVFADDLLARMRLDKKSREGTLQFVLLEGIGHPVICRDVKENLIREVIQELS